MHAPTDRWDGVSVMSDSSSPPPAADNEIGWMGKWCVCERESVCVQGGTSYFDVSQSFSDHGKEKNFGVSAVMEFFFTAVVE